MTQQELDNLSRLPTVTYEQFLKFKPCWLNDRKRAAQLKEIGSRKREWNALDVLRLEEVTIADRMWAVLREEFLPAHLLHEYACRCADYALSKIDNPDPRSVRAIEAKRKWLRGEISNKELITARNEARAASWSIGWGAARAAAWGAARDAAWGAARDAAWGAARDAARKDILDTLISLIKEAARDAGTSTSGKQKLSAVIVTKKEREING
ncbi:hypothetical protein [Solibaculum mannosilyticum]|uniref:Uncharacterized protein n=1 Tax=Solibaculum mannosilyticum TaxID=2780922 RepID=A0A7I8D1X8_9FIRM|nr:hypothetical protein [Solibaculum mannosilyticum]BCI60830.1 hypothetical protein C12CBH8_14690 [Solibaculum mannosilyticum]